MSSDQDVGPISEWMQHMTQFHHTSTAKMAKGVAVPLVSATKSGSRSESGDAADGKGSAVPIKIGDSFSGRVTSGDVDFVKVDLQAGRDYVLYVYGTGGSNAGLSDTRLTVYGPDGMLSSGDVGSNPFSLIQVDAATTGTYYVKIEGQRNQTGNYVLQTSDDTFTPAQVANYMTRFDWSEATPIRFDMRNDSAIKVDLTDLGAEGAKLARWALDAWSVATGIDFKEVATGGQIVFDDAGSGAFAGPQAYSPVTGYNARSTVTVGTGWVESYGNTADSYSFQTYLHEIGHALGLGHAGPYNGAADYGTDNIFQNDTTQMSVMSYFSLADSSSGAGNPSIITPMIADLVAIHQLYGKPQAYAGNTVWGANSNVSGYLGAVFGAVFDGKPVSPGTYSGDAVAFTIFDTGGRDTLNTGPVTANQTIDLRAGKASDIGGQVGNVVIALGTRIENAIGGSGNDVIFGNAANNRIAGGRGNDTIRGGGGTDTAVIGDSYADAKIKKNANGSITITSDDGRDVFVSVERFEFTDRIVSVSDLFGTSSNVPESLSDNGDVLQGTASDDRITGSSGDDTILGGAGDDGLKGGKGDDRLSGGDGNDRLPGEDGNDTIFGEDGNDRLGGGDGRDVMYGGAGDDRGGGGDGDDWISGGSGNDVFSGGAGDDRVDGGAGNDRTAGSFGNDTVIGGSGDDTMGGGAGRDLMHGGAGDDVIGAGSFDDTVNGGAGDDFIGGGHGDDLLRGQDGADTINPGFGNDTITGGDGRDTFVFNATSGGGRTVITDFQDGFDTLRFTGLPDVAQDIQRLDLTAITFQGDTAVQMSYGRHTVIVLDARVSDFAAPDFDFA